VCTVLRMKTADHRSFYIDGKWVSPREGIDFSVVNPANEETIATISLGNAADVDTAVRAAQNSFPAWSETSPEERLQLLQRITEVYKAKSLLLAEAGVGASVLAG